MIPIAIALLTLPGQIEQLLPLNPIEAVLFVDADNDSETGWQGYDIAIHRNTQADPYQTWAWIVDYDEDGQPVYRWPHWQLPDNEFRVANGKVYAEFPCPCDAPYVLHLWAGVDMAYIGSATGTTDGDCCPPPLDWCLTGPSRQLLCGCDVYDEDADGDVDLGDFAIQQRR